MAQKETDNKPANKRTASDVGFTNNDNSPPTKKIKLDQNCVITSDPITQSNSTSKPKSKSGTKRKVALIVSYLGTNYHGSAFSGNKSVPTVSSQLFATLCKIGAVTEQNAIDPKKVSFSASSRTDKGVHAAAATFSLKMINLFEDAQKESILNPPQRKKKKKDKNKNDNDNTTNNPPKDDTKENKNSKQQLMEQKHEYSQWNEMKDLLNKSLCSDIEIHAIQRTTKGFDPRFKAWSRVYHYIIPTYLLDPNIKSTDIANLEHKFCQFIIHKAKARQKKQAQHVQNINQIQQESKQDIFGMNDADLMQFTKDIFEPNSSTNDNDNNNNINAQDIRFEYRISETLVTRLREYCQMYVGTRNYHNFTRKTHPHEDRAKRYMYSIDVINSSLICDGIEYLQFEIHGTSFLYHQIRKMVGLMVILMRNTKYMLRDSGSDSENEKYCSDEKELQRMAFSLDYKMSIALAPSQGLYLKAVRFDEYNKKCIRDGQAWKQLKLEKYKTGVDAFIMNKILPSITMYEVNKKDPLKGNQFAFWLYILDNEFRFEIVKITKELIRELKEKGLEYVTAGNTHEPIDKFYQKIMDKSHKTKQNKINK